MKYIFLLLIFISLSGCYEKNSNYYQFNWAVINKRILQNEVFSIAGKKNPYDIAINIDRTILRRDINKLHSQITNIESDLRDKCRVNKNEEKEKSHKEIHSSIEKDGSIQKLPRVVMGFAGGGVQFDQDCVSKIDSDLLVIDLKKKKDDLEEISRKQTEHDKMIRDFSNQYVKDLIEKYSKPKYEIVIDSGGDSVLYNSNGLVLDITHALIEEIDEESLVISK